MEHRLGWKHEYWDGAARLSPQESAVASLQYRLGSSPMSHPPLREGERLRPVRADDEPALVDLFVRAFDDAVEYAGWTEEGYQRDARDSIASFFGSSGARRQDRPRTGRLDVSFVIVSGGQVLAAMLVRSIRHGSIVEPIMVHPSGHRRGLATTLMSATLGSLHASGETMLFSRCHLGNTASLAWHEKNGFQEIPDFFAASHRWRHFTWLAGHFDYVRRPDKASHMRQLADSWKAVVENLEGSDQRWSAGLLD